MHPVAHGPEKYKPEAGTHCRCGRDQWAAAKAAEATEIGRREAACARHGLPYGEALEREVGQRQWEEEPKANAAAPLLAPELPALACRGTKRPCATGEKSAGVVGVPPPTKRPRSEGVVATRVTLAMKLMRQQQVLQDQIDALLRSPVTDPSAADTDVGGVVGVQGGGAERGAGAAGGTGSQSDVSDEPDEADLLDEQWLDDLLLAIGDAAC